MTYFLRDNFLLDMENSIGIIGIAIFLMGIIALVSAIYLVKTGFQTIETNAQGNPALSSILQFFGGAIGLIIVNSPALFVLNHPNRICIDKDDIACTMVLLIGLSLGVLLINSVAVIAIVVLNNRKKWEIAAGVLSTMSLAAMIVGSFLSRQLWIK